MKDYKYSYFKLNLVDLLSRYIPFIIMFSIFYIYITYDNFQTKGFNLIYSTPFIIILILFLINYLKRFFSKLCISISDKYIEIQENSIYKKTTLLLLNKSFKCSFENNSTLSGWFNYYLFISSNDKCYKLGHFLSKKALLEIEAILEPYTSDIQETSRLEGLDDE